MLTLLIVMSMIQCGSSFVYGFNRLVPSLLHKRSFRRFSAEPDEAIENMSLGQVFDRSRSEALTRVQTTVNITVFPAIDTSPFLIAKYPDPLNRTVQNILGGLSDVTDIEYLNSLPTNDPRARLLATIQDPGSERRAELIENLQAIDAERRRAGKNESTYSVYQKLSREGIDSDLINTLKISVVREALRRRRPEFTEYANPDWVAGRSVGNLVQVVQNCLVENDTCFASNHPCLPVFFPYYNASEPQSTKGFTVTELDKMRNAFVDCRWIYNDYLVKTVDPALVESPIIAEKYPDPADRTPHKLLGGLGNILSIEHMRSLEPHDPRRLFLDTLKAPDEQRCAELESNALLIEESNALLIDRAVAERLTGETDLVPLREVLMLSVMSGLEEAYLTALKSAIVFEQIRLYAKNNGVAGADPEGDEYRKVIADTPVNFDMF